TLTAYLLGAFVLLFIMAAPKQSEAPNPEGLRLRTAPLPAGRNLAPPKTATATPATKPTAKTVPEAKPAKPIAFPKQTPAPETLLSTPPKTEARLPVKSNVLESEPKQPAVENLPAASPATASLDAALKPPATSSPSAQEEPPQLSFNEINRRTRAALVNIICTTKRSGLFEPASGSGVVIDPRGVILTNAHVAEYLLLKNYLMPDFLLCTVRAGEPARSHYKVRLLYISPLWIEKNYKKISEENPTGTGEHDFALLRITESVNQETLPLPSEFPFLPMDESDETLRGRNPVLVAAYPAGFLSGITIQKDLYPSSSVVTAGQVFSFGEETADLFSIGGSVVAQHGSSGGAVVGANGKLVGLIVTSSDAAVTGARDLRAITISHIARSFKKHTGDALDTLVSSDITVATDSFNKNVAPALTKLLEDELNRNSN
ncbi:MAG: hypothetical protein Greene041679_591, partial [Parcubacteria group bacterium Greene0416_79]